MSYVQLKQRLMPENLLGAALWSLSWRACEEELEKQELAALGLSRSQTGVSLGGHFDECSPGLSSNSTNPLEKEKNDEL